MSILADNVNHSMLKDPNVCYSLIQQAAGSIFLVDHENKIIFQNDEARRVFGFEDKELVGHSILDKLHHHYPDGSAVPLEHCKVYRAVSYGETAKDFTWLLTRRDGSQFFASCSVSPLYVDDRHVGAVLLATDLTARRDAEDALKSMAEKLQLATEVAGIGFYDHYPQTGEVIWSETLKRQFGLPASAVVTMETFFSGIHPDDRERVRAAVEKASRPENGGRYHYEYRTLGLVDGRERWIASRGQIIFEGGKPARQIGVTLEITERKRFEESLRQAGQHCPLTGLPNRALLAEYADHLFAMAERDKAESAVLFIDLDRFKPINDEHGHEAGDRVLQEVARRLRMCTRKEDIVSRLGGDEFVVVLPHVETTSDPQTVARHVIERIEQPFSIGKDVHAHLSASIGISLYPKHGSDLDTLLKHADQAMYAAKRGGRNTHRVYIPGEDELSEGKLQLETHLKHALESGQMTLLYQPIVDIHSGKLVGVEALIRLVGANGKLVAPMQFIPIAEGAGLIDKLGNWVAHEACRQHRVWREAGLPPLSMSINISGAQFRQRSFARHLSDAIEESGIDPNCLQIEITESTVMENIGEAAGILNELSDMGISIAIDDFGTGYSSLSYLSTLPLDKLKIDQSFVSRLDSSESSQAVTDTIIGLGRAMNLEVVGEGIESVEAMEYLRDHGCSQAQGYLYSRPLPADEFESWYRSRNMSLH